MEFENDSYVVNKNENVQAVILITYPEYESESEMRIDIRVDEIDDTTTGESLLDKCLTIMQQVLYATMCVHLIESI